MQFPKVKSDAWLRAAKIGKRESGNGGKGEMKNEENRTRKMGAGSGTPAGVRGDLGSAVRGYRGLDPRLLSGNPPGWRRREAKETLREIEACQAERAGGSLDR